MIYSRFMAHKVENQIRYNGQNVVFKTHGVDKYGQVDDSRSETYIVRGLYHTTNAYISETRTDAARVESKPQPAFMVLYEDGRRIQKDDKALIGDKIYRVVDKKDMNDLGIVYDVSLEVVLNG